MLMFIDRSHSWPTYVLQLQQLMLGDLFTRQSKSLIPLLCRF